MAEAENHFLFYRFPDQEQLNFDLPGKRHYWTEYSSPYYVINAIRPDKVVFMGIENMLTIALLSACRKKQVKTYYLAHGVTTGYHLTDKNEREANPDEVPERYQQSSPAYQKKKSHTFKFYFNAWSKAGFKEKLFLMRFLVLSARYRSVHERLYNTKSRFRLADNYIVFTKHLARLLKERDNVEEKRMLEVGPYSLDDLFQGLAKYVNTGKGQPYVLMIDQPIGDSYFPNKKMFWEKLATGWNSLGYRLVIKLHPMDFIKSDPLVHSNIEWVREYEKPAELIGKATACMGYFSAMLLPVIWYKPCGLFNPTNQILIKEWEELKMAHLLDINCFDQEQLADCLKFKKEEKRENYKELFLFKEDGKGVERLIKELIYN